MDITVYTAINSSKDSLIGNQTIGDAKFVAYTDTEITSATWEIKKPYDKFIDPRRNSRIQKILSHQYINSEYSIYIDGNIRLLVEPEVLIEKYLKNHDIAVYRHPNRICLYDEAIVCAKRQLDDVNTIIEQAKMYEDDGFVKEKGLCECGILIRRNTPKVQIFNDIWWSEYCRHSRRDQISFIYAIDKAGLRLNVIDDLFIEKSPTLAVKQSGDFEIVTHNHYA